MNLFKVATERNSLREAWSRIRSNGQKSQLRDTKEAIEAFSQRSERNIWRIQHALRGNRFQFAPQQGVIKAKRSGGKRGIVMAPVHNRIVERAWLDCLQQRVQFVKDVINVPTSVGGVPDRSVPHGLAQIKDAMSDGKTCFVRSDISGFFDSIPRKGVIDRLSEEIDDEQFLNILEKATEVTLSNEKALGEDRKSFPTDDDGVAQGSPLSPLFGNILLNEFDKKFNDRGIVCIRFIDDFILLGSKSAHVEKAFESAKLHLSALKLQCHDPFQVKDSEKSSLGDAKNGFIFLGYKIEPGLFQPSPKARNRLLFSIRKNIHDGKISIREVCRSNDSFAYKQRFVQTLHLIDCILHGWGEAFAYSNSPATMADLDKKIDREISDFRSWYRNETSALDWKGRRRAGGVCLLEDISAKRLDELPFRLPKPKRFRDTKNLIIISTDGSLRSINTGTRSDRGPGGWAAVFHGRDRRISGHKVKTTNIRMELTAVLEALRETPAGSRVEIRTDSRYVHDIVNERNMIRKNHDLWKEFQLYASQRHVRVTWVRGHSGDSFNEQADRLANEEAGVARRLVLRQTDTSPIENDPIDALAAQNFSKDAA